MKFFSFILYFIIPFAALCQQHKYDPCAGPFTFDGYTIAGYNQHGPIADVEFGLWGVTQPFGGTLGAIVLNEPTEQIIAGKSSIVMQVQLELQARLTVKVYQNVENTFFMQTTAFYQTNDNIGLSCRFFRRLGPFVLMGLEPNWGTKSAAGLNLIFAYTLQH